MLSVHCTDVYITITVVYISINVKNLSIQNSL